MAIREHVIPGNFRKPGPTLLYILGIPIFSITFLMIFTPFHLESLMDFPHASYQFNVLICSGIMLIVYIASRATMCGTRKKFKLTWNWYIFWSFAEVAAISFLSSIYIWLISSQYDLFLIIFFKAIAILLSIIIFPYAIATLSLTVAYMNKENQDDDESLMERIHFYDEKHNLKFVAQSSSIYFIEANENYVNIHYCERDKMRNFTLRSSMKSIEEICSEHKLLRCHRSYFINPQHIRVLRKEKEGMIYAEMDSVEEQRIPVSKKHYDQLIEYL